MTPGGLEIAVDAVPEGARLVATGEVDLATVAQLVSAAETATPSGGTLEVDLSAVEFMDSAGIAAINRCRAHARRCDAQIALVVRTGGPVAQLIEWTGLEAVVDVRYVD